MPPEEIVHEGSVVLDIHTDFQKVKAVVRHLVSSATTPENALVLLLRLNLKQQVYAVEEDEEDQDFWIVLILSSRREESPIKIRCYKGPQSQSYGGNS